MQNLEKGNYIWQNLFSILWIGNAFCWVSVIFKIPYISSIIFAMSLAIVLIMAIFSLNKEIEYVKTSTFLFIAVAILSLLSLIMSNINMANIKQYIQYMMLFLMMFVMQMFTINKNNYNIMFYSSAFVGILFIIGYILFPNNLIAGAITLNFHNPNAAGLTICVNTLFMVSLTKKRSLKTQIFIYIVAFVDFYILTLTMCRSAIVSCSIGLILSLMLTKQSKKTNKGIIILVLNIPIIFLIGYILLYLSELLPDGFMIGEKKLFSGRERVWIPILEFMFSNIQYGLFGHFLAGNSFNSQGSLFFSFGIFGFTAIMLFIIKYVFSINDLNSKYSRVYLWMLLCTLLIGCAESAIITGMLTIFIYLGSYIQIAKYEKMDENKKEENKLLCN